MQIFTIQLFIFASMNKKYNGYKTNLGECICGDSLDLLNTLNDESVDLVVTSPPFALQRKKEYGNCEQDEYVQWLVSFAKIVYKKLKKTGSFVIDIGSAYEKGKPIYSLYQFRTLIALCDDVGFKLAQPFYWHNPSALPAPIEWVNKRKLRAKNSVNTIWWLCKDEHVKANVSNILVPYSDRMKALFKNPDDFIKSDSAERPSGHVVTKSSWLNNNGGAIPPNLIEMSNSESNSQYLRYCKLLGIKGHPARFPPGIPQMFIKFLTDKNDLVVDIFGGSNTTGMVAEQLGRKWKVFELSNEYISNSVLRFCDTKEKAEQAYKILSEGGYVNIKEINGSLL